MDLVEKSADNSHRHPWELARKRFVLSLIKTFPSHFVYADVGAGDQFIAQHISRQTNAAIWAVDSHYDTLPSDVLSITSCRRIDDIAPQSVDVVLLLDVLEHVHDEHPFLMACLKILKPAGTIIITVPAFQFLFSDHDVFLNHCRRYNKRRLGDTINQLEADLNLVSTTYFFFTLLVARSISAIWQKCTKKSVGPEGVGRWPYPENHLITKTITGLLSLDMLLGKKISSWGIPLPGLSLCMIHQKKF